LGAELNSGIAFPGDLDRVDHRIGDGLRDRPDRRTASRSAPRVDKSFELRHVKFAIGDGADRAFDVVGDQAAAPRNVGWFLGQPFT
jgi:hypothetical protein